MLTLGCGGRRHWGADGGSRDGSGGDAAVQSANGCSGALRIVEERATRASSCKGHTGRLSRELNSSAGKDMVHVCKRTASKGF